jgi:hypothetical protein
MNRLGRAGSRQASDSSISSNDISTRPALSPLATPFVPQHLHQTTIPLTHDTNATSTWGDTIDHPTAHCRIAFQNINGLNDKAHLIGSQTSALGIHILGMAETNTDWQTRDTKSSTTSILKRYGKKTSFSFSSSNHRHQIDNKHTKYQLGGTMMVVKNPWSARCTTSHDQSGMGRWSSATLSGKENRKVTILTIYRVCKGNVRTDGPRTAFSQQWHLGDSINLHPNDPRQQTLSSVSRELDRLKAAGHEVIVMMDANESTQTNNNKLSDWIRANHLVDPMIARHGNDNIPCTYKRGSNRIDYILTTRNIANYITSAGFLSYNHLAPSDHKALFIDVDLSRYLKGDPHVELSYSCHGLQSNNPRAVAKYQRIVTKYLDSSTMELEMDQFQKLQASQGFLHQDQIDRIIQLETDFSNCKAAAEEKVKHITHIPWSPTLRDCLHKISYWKSWISQIKNAIDESDYRARICPLYPTLIVPPSTAECKTNLKTAYKENKTATNNADDLRLKHLQDLATMYSNSGNETSCQALKRIIRSEAISNTFRHLKNIMNPSTEFGLNHLLMNGPNKPPLPIYEQDELEQALLDRNNIHFRQADKTPFSTNYLKLLLGPYGTNEASQMLLDGTLQIDFTQVSRATASILRKLQRVAAPDSIDASISMEELKAAYKCWRESTSTSPSGLHLGQKRPPS